MAGAGARDAAGAGAQFGGAARLEVGLAGVSVEGAGQPEGAILPRRVRPATQGGGDSSAQARAARGPAGGGAGPGGRGPGLGEDHPPGGGETGLTGAPGGPRVPPGRARRRRRGAGLCWRGRPGRPRTRGSAPERQTSPRAPRPARHSARVMASASARRLRIPPRGASIRPARPVPGAPPAHARRAHPDTPAALGRRPARTADRTRRRRARERSLALHAGLLHPADLVNHRAKAP